jgi:hypothetical protein
MPLAIAAEASRKRHPISPWSESPRYVGRAVAALAADPNRQGWNQRSITSGELAHEYGFTDIDGTQPDIWRYMSDVGDHGKQVDVSQYR